MSLAQTPSNNQNKLGVKTSINLSSLTGNELQNPRLKYGYTAGAYYIYNANEKWNVYSELVGNFKGSKFRNGDTGYSEIALFYVDLAVLPMYKLNGEDAISFGPYASYLGLSSLYVGPKKKAEDIDKMGISPWDAGFATYYTKHNKIAAFQVGAKIGLKNANENVFFEDYFPKTGNGGFIRNISLEIGVLF
ncbi:MAG: hypothetical protein ACPGTP_02580 [Bacteroidia bacterium]